MNFPSRTLTATSPVLAVVFLLLPGTSPFCSAAVLPAPHAAAPRTPRDWAVVASENEIRAITHDTSLLRYQVRTVDQKGERVREVLECTGGSVARLRERDGKPLTPDEDAAERDRLQQLLNAPGDFAHHAHSDATDKKLAADLVRLMPDAMLYSPAANEASAHAPNGAPLIVLDFAPNPAWSPPTLTSEALTGLRGRMWIDEQTGYVVRMEGEIFRPVNFGYGMVAHVYPGGRLSLSQVPVGADRWIYSHFEEHIRVRALLFKTLDINTSVESSHYDPVPGPLTWQQAIQLLLH